MGCYHPSISTDSFIPPANVRKVVVTLIDSLGAFTMYIPERYDTSFAWIHYSDTKSCDKIKCRFQPKILPINMENGWFWRVPLDSVDCLTIIYSPHFMVQTVDTTWVSSVGKSFQEKMKVRGTETDIILDTLYKIYDRPFAVSATSRYIPQLHRQCYKLTAVTSVRMMDITFEFELITEKKDTIGTDFMKKEMDLLQTIKFTKEPW